MPDEKVKGINGEKCACVRAREGESALERERERDGIEVCNEARIGDAAGQSKHESVTERRGQKLQARISS